MRKTIEISDRLAEMMRTDEAHLTETLERFGYLVRSATKDNEGTFTMGERRLMTHAAESARFDPRLDPVETLVGIIEQEARIEDLDTLYEVDLDALLIKIRDLHTIRAWAIVEALAIVQLPHVNREQDELWTVTGRKHLLAGKRRKKSGPKGAENGFVPPVMTHEASESETASYNGSGRVEVADSV